MGSLLRPLLSLLFVAAFAAPVFGAGKSEYIVDVLDAGSGNARYFIAQDAMRVEILSNGGAVLVKAPLWKVSCYRPSEKLEYTSDLKDFDQSSIVSRAHKKVPLSGTPIRQPDETIKGLKCRKYKIADGTIVWTPADMVVAPQISEFLARYLRSFNYGCAPVRVMKPETEHTAQAGRPQMKEVVPWINLRNLDLRPDQRLVLDLIKWKKVPYRAADFEYPKGFKTTDDLKEIMIPASSRKQLIELIDGAEYKPSH